MKQQDVAVACGDVFGCASVDVEVDIVPVGRTDHKHHRNALLLTRVVAILSIDIVSLRLAG